MATEREEAVRMPAAAPSPSLPSQPLRPRPLRVPPLLLSGGPDENGAWISPDEENLSLLGDKYAIKMRFSDDPVRNIYGDRDRESGLHDLRDSCQQHRRRSAF